MLEVEPTRQRGSRGHRNNNKAVATSEAFARWLHHWYAPVELPSAVGVYRLVTCFILHRVTLNFNLQLGHWLVSYRMS